jgi:hypothetical protein
MVRRTEIMGWGCFQAVIYDTSKSTPMNIILGMKRRNVYA